MGERQACYLLVLGSNPTKVLKALVWRLHARFPCSYVQNGLYLT